MGASSTHTALLSGFYGRLNCGDDALLAVSAWACRRFFGAESLYATSARPLTLLDPGVKSVYWDQARRGTFHINLLREAWIVRRSDLIVFGGGSVLHSRPDLDRWSSWLSRARRGLRFAAGVSVGPFASAGDAAACSRFLRQLDFVGVRDRASLARVQDLAPDCRAELTFDIAPLLFTDVAVPAAASGVGSKEGLVVSVCEPRFLVPRKTWLDDLAAALRQVLADGLVHRLTFVDFNAEHNGRPDGAIHEELRNRIGATAMIDHHGYSGDPRKTGALLRGATAVVAMRLHAAVFAYAHGRPTVILPYHEKCLEWAAMIRQPEELTLRIGEWGPADVHRAIARAVAPAPPRPLLPAPEARRQALRNWTWYRA
jgi:polysaccharide pyruvyl transferase WcaK-like protein